MFYVLSSAGDSHHVHCSFPDMREHSMSGWEQCLAHEVNKLDTSHCFVLCVNASSGAAGSCCH